LVEIRKENIKVWRKGGKLFAVFACIQVEANVSKLADPFFALVNSPLADQKAKKNKL